MPKIKLGDKVRDKFTGLEGYVHGIAEYITGCNQILLNPRVVKDGAEVPGTWYDDSRIVLVEELPTPAKHDNGGPSLPESAGLKTS